MALKNYKLVKAEGLGALRTPKGTYNLNTLTDEQAAILHEMKCPYIEKVEKAPRKTRKKSI